MACLCFAQCVSCLLHHQLAQGHLHPLVCIRGNSHLFHLRYRVNPCAAKLDRQGNTSASAGISFCCTLRSSGKVSSNGVRAFDPQLSRLLTSAYPCYADPYDSSQKAQISVEGLRRFWSSRTNASLSMAVQCGPSGYKKSNELPSLVIACDSCSLR